MMQCEAGLDVVRDRGSLKKKKRTASKHQSIGAVKNVADFPEPFVSVDPDLSER